MKETEEQKFKQLMTERVKSFFDCMSNDEKKEIEGFLEAYPDEYFILKIIGASYELLEKMHLPLSNEEAFYTIERYSALLDCLSAKNNILAQYKYYKTL